MRLTTQQMYDIICYGCDGLTEKEDDIVCHMVLNGYNVNECITEIMEYREEQFRLFLETEAVMLMAA